VNLTRCQREAEVLAEIRAHRSVSVFWFDAVRGRHAARVRLEKRGVIACKVGQFPMWGFTIKKGAG
jgi:hypothetical protein